jgi:hypothetical protein
LKIIYFSPIDWDFIYQRPQHLAERLSASNIFIYVQPFGLRNLSYLDIPRIYKRVRSLFKTQNPKKYLYIKNPFFIPLHMPLVSKLNSFLLKYQIQSLVDSNTIIWVAYPSPFIALLLNHLKYGALVYEMMDDYSHFHPLFEKEIKHTEQWFIKKASLIITTSDALFEKAKLIKRDGRISIIRNGVDYNFFTHTQKPFPKEFQGMNKIVGYIGSIEKWIDFDLIDFLSKNLLDVNFIFIGPKKIKKVPLRKNIFYFGSIDYKKIPVYCYHFNVCLIPFLQNDFSNFINPVKLYEYFALGKPIVSYYMKELESYKEVIYLAENKESFLTQIEKALNEKDEEIIRKRKEIARINDWTNIVNKVNEELLKLFD